MNRNSLIALFVAALIGLGIYWLQGPESKVKIAPVAEKATSEGSMATWQKHVTPVDVPPLAFFDAAGAAKDNAVFKGKVTLLNLWATWCVPCRKEMPELAQLQRDLGGADFQVVALSEDLKGYEASAAFMKQVGAENLALYADEKATVLDALVAPGLPITLLLNRDGKEIGRLLGPAPWASNEAKAIIKAAVESK